MVGKRNLHLLFRQECQKRQTVIPVKSVKRTKPEANETANEPQNILSELKQNVDTAHFAQAISLLQTPEGQTLSQAYPSLHGWQAEASVHVDFYQAIGQISTYSLALMKLNYVHPENTNNLNQ